MRAFIGTGPVLRKSFHIQRRL